MKRVYVAGPYSRGDIVLNIREALFHADWLMAAGYIPFVPHLTGFWHLCFPRAYESWLAYDMEWLRVCDALLRMSGESPGADREVAEAQRLGIPVFYSVPELIGGLSKD
jgi:hypothetical protein